MEKSEAGAVAQWQSTWIISARLKFLIPRKTNPHMERKKNSPENCRVITVFLNQWAVTFSN